jgi:DNA primase
MAGVARLWDEKGAGMNFDREFTDRVKNSIDIGDVIGGQVELKQRGSDHVGICPFCQHKKKTFSVSASKRIFKCFACDEGGDVIKFMMLFQNRKFPELIEDLAKSAGIPVPENVSWKTEKKRKPQKRASEAKSSVDTAESSTPTASDGARFRPRLRTMSC